jgi:putative oxidoreductase
MFGNIQATTNNRAAGAVRILLGIMFLMTGLMKFFVPMLRDAFHGQLTQAGIPLVELNMWLVPGVEVVVGLMMLIGIYSRLACILIIGTMLIATNVHLVVHDPALFPLQPTQPIIPFVVNLMSLYILWVGGGSWSKDLKFSETKT